MTPRKEFLELFGARDKVLPLEWRFQSLDAQKVAALRWKGRWMTRKQVLDLYFLDARCKLIDIAAFLDRVDRGDGDADFRWTAFREAIEEILSDEAERARRVLLRLSDPTGEPIPAATTKAACGAWPGAAPESHAST